MHNVRVGKCDCDEVVHMSGKAPKTCLVTHKAMDVHKQHPTQI